MLTSPQGFIMKANQKAQDIFEYSEKELQKMRFSEFTHPDDIESNMKVFNQLTSGELKYYEFDKRYITKKGKTIWVSLTSSAVENEDGDVEYALTTLQDVTERKEVELALTESEKRLAGILDNLAGMAFKYRIGEYDAPVFVSEGCETITGFKASEIYAPDFKWTSKVPEEDARRSREKIEESISKSEQIEVSYRFQHKNGRMCWFLERSKPVYDDTGKPYAIEGIVFDISDLKEYQDKLEDNLHEKEVMIQEIHHRVKNNMAIVSGLLELQRYTFENEQLSRILQKNVLRIKSIALVHEALYKNENFTRIDLIEFFNDLAKTEKQAAEAMGIDISFEVSGVGEFININQAVPIGLIVNEMISNAIEHGFDERKEGTIQIEIHNDENQFEIRVSNNGKALPESFSIFSEMGLGLNIIRVLCTQIGAHIEVVDLNKPTFVLKIEKKDRKGSSSAFL